MANNFSNFLIGNQTITLKESIKNKDKENKMVQRIKKVNDRVISVSKNKK
mgnify:CR=1 FL=1